jgi:HD-like signal output (HDOD) protein
MLEAIKLQPIKIDPRTFLRQHCTLPSLPGAMAELQRVIRSGNVDTDKVAELVSSDPALLAQALKIVNSAYYGLPREIGDVRFAIAFLGLNEIYRMVLSLSVINTLAINRKDELDDFWFHSFYAALCTKYLANKYNPHLSFEELWSAAMLHDIGKLVYLKFFPDHYTALKAFSQEQGCLFSEAERHFSLPSSAFFGTLLCDHWRLPEKIRKACEFHSPRDLLSVKENTPSADFLRMICLGNLLAIISTDELTSTNREDISAAAQSALNLTGGQFLTLMGDIYELRTEVERFTDQFH